MQLNSDDDIAFLCTLEHLLLSVTFSLSILLEDNLLYFWCNTLWVLLIKKNLFHCKTLWNISFWPCVILSSSNKNV
jgi:hypothetical protein